MRALSFAILLALPGVGAAQAPAGQRVFGQWCAACHARVSGGDRLPGTTALEMRYKGERPAALEDRTDLTPDLVKLFVRKGVKSMPPFRRTEVSDVELDALAAYLAKAR